MASSASVANSTTCMTLRMQMPAVADVEMTDDELLAELGV